MTDQAVSVGNVWLQAATMLKIGLPEGARPSDGYLLLLGNDGDLQLVGPLTEEGRWELQPGYTAVCAIAVDTPVERIAHRLRDASQRGH